MSKTDTSFKVLSLRLPTALHATATEIAQHHDKSLTGYIVEAVQERVRQELVASPSRDGEPAPFEVHLQFLLHDERADERAYRIVDAITNVTELTGGADVVARLVRVATMPPRSDS